jgi:hydrogenase expression/formation protein HypE
MPADPPPAAADRSILPICPAPVTDQESILLAHGGGGRLMHELIDRVFLPAFDHPGLARRHDATVVAAGGLRLAVTTDSYVVHPLFFPGGDIGSLAVHGTINDLAMSGARPLCLSAGFILEEGFPLADLRAVVRSMSAAARLAGVPVVTGDTKVVDHGKADGLFINTAGVGVVPEDVDIGPWRVRPEDAVILSGDLGRHGVAILAAREGLSFETAIQSDSACLAGAVAALLSDGIEVHCLRDLTRGGLASALNEIAAAAGAAVEIDESGIPIDPQVRGACELLGLDPLYVACEGRFVLFTPAAQERRALEVIRGHDVGAGATAAGRVRPGPPGRVTLRTGIGSSRIVDMLSGEQLPRIC